MLILFVWWVINRGVIAVTTSVDHICLSTRLSIPSRNWHIYFLVVRIPIIVDFVFPGVLAIDGGNTSGTMNIATLRIISKAGNHSVQLITCFNGSADWGLFTVIRTFSRRVLILTLDRHRRISFPQGQIIPLSNGRVLLLDVWEFQDTAFNRRLSNAAI